MITKEFKITAKSQVTIPNEVKTTLGIHAGDEIFFKIDNGHVEIVPNKEQKISIWDLGKKYKIKHNKKISVEQMNQAIQDKWKNSGNSSL